MPDEIQEVVAESIEEIVMDDVVGEEKKGKRHARPRWEIWIALFSSLLAVLSAVAALLANFVSDRAAIALDNEGDYAAYAEGVNVSQTILKSKLEILRALGKQPTAEDLDEVRRVEEQRKEFQARGREFEEDGERSFKVHDHLAMAVTLFQVHMLLGGLAVIVERAAIWRFGMVFSAGGLFCLVYGIIGYLA